MPIDHLEALMGNVHLHDGFVTATPQQLTGIRLAVAGIRQGGDSRLSGMRVLRQLLGCEDPPPPIDAILDSGVAPIVIHFLHPDAEENSPELLFETSWTMLNLMSGDASQVARCIQSTDAMTALMALLADTKVSVVTREHGAWAIGNIAGTGHRFRQDLLEHGCLPHLVQFVADCASVGFNAGNGIWAITNLCRVLDGERPDVHPFVAVLPQLLHATGAVEEVARCAMFLVQEITTRDSVRVMAEHGQLYVARNYALWCLGVPWDTTNSMSVRLSVMNTLATMTSSCVEVEVDATEEGPNHASGLVCSDATLMGMIIQGGVDKAALWVIKEHLRQDSDAAEAQLCAVAAAILRNICSCESAALLMEEEQHASLTILGALALLPTVPSADCMDATLMTVLSQMATALWCTYFSVASAIRRRNSFHLLSDHHKALTDHFPQSHSVFPGALLCPQLLQSWTSYLRLVGI